MNQVPRTIEGLKRWYINRKLPPENITIFFIGRDYKGARAFGIYKDEITGKYIVYKNKSDGTRVIRYEGDVELLAVNEFYKKLKSEINNQKYNRPMRNNIKNNFNNKLNYNNYSNSYAGRTYTGRQIKLISPMMIIIIFLVFIGLIGLFNAGKPKRGYYKYYDNYYYYQSGKWYLYENTWSKVTEPEELSSNYSDYYESSSYMHSYGINKFENTRYYKTPIISFGPSSSSSTSYDSEYDWDYDYDWDSDYTDWDSDW